ncbi:MAG: hypothetical protein IPK95_06175 [Cellvibrionales bacterium]|nr:hypothetical protein [Cellvibrionales bacterium]
MPDLPYTRASGLVSFRSPQSHDDHGTSHVLGNFSAAPLGHHGQQTHFSDQASGYQISTDQQTSSAATLDLAYTFGVFPLQQYLTALPDGRLQSLPFAWDSRADTAGGQRWFHLYDNENIIPGDVLHWRSPSHNANHMCIECHTTNFAKITTQKQTPTNHHGKKLV